MEEAVKAKRRKADEYRREAKKSKSEEEKKGLVAKAEACIKAASDIKVRFMLVSSRVVSRMVESCSTSHHNHLL